MWDALGYLLTTLLFITSIFLILLILVQRGKGGGLVGALGGMGGQSAFGAKAGGIFWATSVAAGVWILLCVATVAFNGAGRNAFAAASGANSVLLKDAPSAVESSSPPTETDTTGAAAPGKTPANTTATPAAGDAKKGEVGSAKDFNDQAPAGDADAKK